MTRLDRSACALAALVLSLMYGCSEPRSGTSWAFDRQTGFPCEVSIVVHVPHPGAQKFQTNLLRKTIYVNYEIAVDRQWQMVNFYTITDWKTDTMGNRSETLLGEVSDPVGYVTPPQGFAGGPSEIPADVRRRNSSREPDALPLGRYPVELRWWVALKTDAKRAPLIDPATEGLPKEIIRSTALRSIIISEKNLEMLLETGHQDFTLWIEVRPVDWSDAESLQLFQKSWKSGFRNYTIHFDRGLLIEALGK